MAHWTAPPEAIVFASSGVNLEALDSHVRSFTAYSPLAIVVNITGRRIESDHIRKEMTNESTKAFLFEEDV
jgi:hypothetical protein